MLNLTPGFNRLSKDNYKMRREAFKFWYLVHLILETLRYMLYLLIDFISWSIVASQSSETPSFMESWNFSRASSKAVSPQNIPRWKYQTFIMIPWHGNTSYITGLCEGKPLLTVVNTMVVDALVLCIIRPSAAMELNMHGPRLSGRRISPTLIISVEIS